MESTPSFQYIESKEQSLPKEYSPDDAWISKLVRWFTTLRIYLSNYSQNECSFEHLLDLIGKQEEPSQKIGCSGEVDYVLEYFARQTKNFTRIDLSWIFYLLACLDRYVTKETSIVLELLLTKINKQIVNSKELENFKYLCLISTLISSFYHVSTEN